MYKINFNQFDKVKLKTTRNVNYLSAISEADISPQGVWTIVGAVDNKLLLHKGPAVILIPPGDVLKVADYKPPSLTFGENDE